MELRHLFSLTALSLCGFTGIYAESSSEQEGFAMLEEAPLSGESLEKTDSEQKTVRPLAVASNSGDKSAPAAENQTQPKVKPHFAGARRPLEVKKVSNPNKPKRVKNQWFSSKTQPKIEKKESVYEEVAKLPSDHPHFVKTEHLVAQSQDPKSLSSSRPVPIYPKTGVEAPNGHLFITGEWLYWRVREEGTEFVTNTSLEFDYSSGFRVGLGVHLPYTDGWDIYANYTYFCPDASRGVEGSFYPLFLYQGSGLSGSSVTSAHGHLSINFQTMDLAFGRAFYLAKSLSVHPFAGMKGAWIDQSSKFDYAGGYIPEGRIFSTHFTNDFKGAGPLFGLNTHWNWGAGLSLLGTLSSALVIGHFDNHQTQDQLSEDVIHYVHGFNLVSPMAQMLVAFAWDRNFNHDRSHVGLSLGFETQYWWSQNQIELFTGASVPSYQRQKGDLALYGLTLQGRFDF